MISSAVSLLWNLKPNIAKLNNITISEYPRIFLFTFSFITYSPLRGDKLLAEGAKVLLVQKLLDESGFFAGDGFVAGGNRAYKHHYGGF